MTKFNHAYDFAFEVISDKEDASDVTEEMLLESIRARVDRIADPLGLHGDTMMDACDCFDTHEIEPGEI